MSLALHDQPLSTQNDNSLWHNLLLQYREVRNQSEAICQPLAVEDYCIQTMPDVSPPKWHLAHVSWFFETFILLPFQHGYQPFHPQFDYLFNSYYETHNRPFPRPQRGLLSRPTVADVYAYRAHVDEAMTQLLNAPDEQFAQEIKDRLTLGLHHEQQHQELLLTDIKHILAFNPLCPSYQAQGPFEPAYQGSSLHWLKYQGGNHSIGHAGQGFSFDNEAPRHMVYLQDYALASRLVTNGEYMAFMDAGGYDRPEYWLSEGWHTVNSQNWQAPLYWQKRNGRWWHMTLAGLQPVLEQEPVSHVSFYEADAYARWTGKRLPLETEWELAAIRQPIAGNFRESGHLRPRPSHQSGAGLQQLFGDVWEWTQSPYVPYPGYRPLKGSLGEYNGKFMSNQMVLRGGSCVTPQSHIRPTYRNFFYPGDRWQFSGIRLADDRHD
jgi:ergothioneine biosynthesis protein EgtB